MAPKYTLVYFNGKGRAEIARLVFAAAGQEYTDKRHEFSEWEVLKSETPFGFLPVLEFDGIKISQHLTIARYLAREFGLGGKDSVEQALAESVAETAVELYQAGYPIMMAADETKKAALKKTYLEETAPKLLKCLEKFLKCNGGGDGYFVGKGLTWADLIVLHGIEVALGIGVKLAEYPKITANSERVKALPKIKAYLKARPDTSF